MNRTHKSFESRSDAVRTSATFRRAALTVVAISLLAAALAWPGPVRADSFPPYWGAVDPANGPVHFPVLPWPEEDAWASATIEGIPIIDKRIADPSNGGRAPQNYVNVSSSCTSGNPDQVNPSVAWMYNEAGPGGTTAPPTPTLFFRWLVEQIPNTYATGPSAQPASSVDPYFSAQWTVLLDVDGDGFREFAVNIAGMSGSPSEPIDVIRSIYSNTPSQSIDYAGDPQIHYLSHQPSAFVDPGTGKILNFQNIFAPVPTWPNGSAERIWDYGQSRVRNASNENCNEYVIDFQIPLGMLDAAAVGGPTFTKDTPVCMAFVTANSNQNPLQKDVAFDGTKSFVPEDCVPCSDLITFGGGPIVQPVVDSVAASGCGPSTLTARVRDALKVGCQDTLTTVEFYSYRDRNANGDDDDGESWTLIGAGTADPANPSVWSVSWDTRALNAGQYLVGVKAVDDSGNATWSWLTEAEATALGAYANPAGVGVVVDTLLNSCGEVAALKKSVSPAYTSAGGDVTFTLAVRNGTSSAFTLLSLADALPPGFSYRAVPAEGGALAAATHTSPADGATGTVTWAFTPPVSVAAGATATLSFTARVAPDAGTYSNTAAAATSDPDWPSLVSNTVDVGVGAPQLTIAKRPSVWSAVPGDTVTYTVTYANDSPVNATAVVVTDTLPAGLGFVAADGGGVYDEATRTITWSVGSLASGEGPRALTYQVVVDQGAATRTENTATIDAAETSPATATTAIHVPTPLQIQKTANKTIVDPRGVSPANQVVYTIGYRNTGTAPLTGATITDTTMPGFTYAGCTGGCAAVEPSGDGRGDDDGTCEAGEPCTATWTIGNLAAGASGTVTLTLTVTDPYAELTNPATNVATIDTNETGPFLDAASVVVRDYDCGGAKERFYFHDLDASGLPAPWTGAAPGTPLPATLLRGYATTTAPTSPVATNISTSITGDAAVELAHFSMDPPLSRASGFSITGTVDMQAFMSKAAGGTVNVIGYLYDYDPETGEAVQIGAQAADSGSGLRDNFQLNFSVTPSGIVREGNLLMWRLIAQRTSSYTGPVTFHFDGTATTGTEAGLAYGDVCFAPLSITMAKTVNLLEAGPSTPLTYTLAFSNSGQRAVSGARIVDTLPVGVTYTGATLNGAAVTPVGGTCSAGSPCTFDVRTSDNPTPFPVAGAGSGGILSGGASGTLVITATTNASLAGITTLTNRARLENANTDPVEDTATTDVTRTPTPEIFLQKAASATLLNPGDAVTYTVTAVNVGDATASAISVADTVPVAAPWFTYEAGSIAGGSTRDDSAAPALAWTIASLAPGQSATMSFRMLVAATGLPAGVSTLDNAATASEGPRTATSNTVRVFVTANANLALAKAVASPVGAAAIGTGDGSRTSFDATLAGAPLQAGSLEVSVAGTRVGTDSGSGEIVGAGLVGSTVDYVTGALHLAFAAPPLAGAAVTATWRSALAPGALVEYALTVSSTGGSAASGVAVVDPIPAGASYVAGTLRVDGASRTDAGDGDGASYDGSANRVLFSLGDLARDTSRTLRFSVRLDGSFAGGTTAVTNVATASAANTASKSDSAVVAVSTAPALALSKNGPAALPYPVATLSGNHANATTLTLASPPGSQYLEAGDRIFVNGLLRAVTGIVSATQVTVDQPTTAGGGTPVLPVIRYTLSYANTGTAAASGVRVKDVLPAGLNYLAATPAPTAAPAFNTNGYLRWDLGTVAPGQTATIVVYARPTATGTYANTATLSAAEVAEFPSNTVTTAVGAVLVRKGTSTPAIINNPADGTPEVGTYTITLAPQTALPVNNATITDRLPLGFTFRSQTSVVGGTCGTTPAAGASTAVWVCNVTANPMTITFTVNVAATTGAGTYQNPVSVSAPGVASLAFDELATTAEDVTVSIPNDISIAKVVLSPPAPCPAPTVGSCIVYRITARNVGSGAVTGIVVEDRDSSYTSFPPPDLSYVSHAASLGSFDASTGVWSVGALQPGPPPASPIAATLDVTFLITNTLASSLTNCARRSAGTDTNPANDQVCANSLPTLVTLASFEAFVSEGGVVVEWQTASQYLTAGFHLYRVDAGGAAPLRLTDRLVPGFPGARQGGVYRVADPGAPVGRELTYLLAETEASGRVRTLGPFTVRPLPRTADSGESTSGAAARSSEASAARHGARIAAARAEIAAGEGMAGEPDGSGRALKLFVEREGLHYLDAARIATLTGAPEERVRAAIRAANYSLTNRGRQVAYRRAAEGRGLYFYGRAVESIYTRRNVYRLTPGRGLLMQSIAAPVDGPEPLTSFRARLHVEQDLTPVTEPMMKADRDFWFWGTAYVDAAGAEPLTLPFDVPAPAQAAEAARIQLSLQGWTATGVSPEHHARVRLNGTVIGDALWSGATALLASLEFDQALLLEGANSLEVEPVLEAGVPVSVFFVNFFDVEYLRHAVADANRLSVRAATAGVPLTAAGFDTDEVLVLDLSRPGRPRVDRTAVVLPDGGTWSVTFTPRTSGGRTLVSAPSAALEPAAEVDRRSSLRTPGHRARYLVVAPRRLRRAAEAFADYRRSLGLTAETALLDDVYDEFNHGIESPRALRAFLRYAATSWEVPPRHVLLLGDGSLDYKDVLGFGENLVPVLLAETPFGLYPSDGLFADFDGDHVPELSIGRIPALSVAEALAVLDKLKASEPLRSLRVVVATDNADEAGDFPADGRESAALVPPQFEIRTVSLEYAAATEAHDQLLREWGRGAALVNYIGHGSLWGLAAEDLLTVGDVPALAAAGRLPVLSAFTCMAGNFANPGSDSLAEALMLAPGGALAVWAPAGMSYNDLAKILNAGLFRAVFAGRRTTLGAAVRQALGSYRESGQTPFMMDIYNLLGDPALQVP